MNRLRAAGLIWPGLFTLLALVILVWLGNWQMRRLAWKEGLISRIEQRVTAPPVSLAKAEMIWRATGDIEYLRVRASGRFDHATERHYFTSRDGQTGWDIYTLLQLPNGRAILVNRGFVDAAHKAPSARPKGQIKGVVTIVGLLRQAGEKGLFTPDNLPAKNEWYWRDLAGMTASLGDDDKAGIYPFFLEAGSGSQPAVAMPRPGVTRLKLTNKHLGYALTWYGLALALIGVFVVYGVPRWKKAGRAPS